MNGLFWRHTVATGFCLASIIAVASAQAEELPTHYFQTGDYAASEKLRRLDMMLMVTALRCRTTPHDFEADFQAFEARHLPELNAAARDIVAKYKDQMGAFEANKMLDQISVRFANEYGNGHPWLGCRDLKALTQRLAAQDGPEGLLQAADEIVDGDSAPPDVAGAARADQAPVATAVAVADADQVGDLVPTRDVPPVVNVAPVTVAVAVAAAAPAAAESVAVAEPVGTPPEQTQPQSPRQVYYQTNNYYQRPYDQAPGNYRRPAYYPAPGYYPRPVYYPAPGSYYQRPAYYPTPGYYAPPGY